MSDTLQKSLSQNKEAVLYVIDCRELVQESMERVQTWPPATKHLGQAMMASLLLQALTEAEDNETVSLQWMCEGVFGHLYSEARNYGEVRGTIQNPQANVPDFSTDLGPGILQVRRSRGGQPGTTSVVSSTGQVSTDVVEYLEKSEQRNCGINLSVKLEWDEHSNAKVRVASALGYLVHILPQPSEAKMNEALYRWDRQMAALGPISEWALSEKNPTLDMLCMLASEDKPNLVMTQRVKFSCNCNEERATRALALLEAQEASEGMSIVEAPTEIRCEYCGRNYTIAPGKTATLKSKKSGKRGKA